ncbi:hypothetical protein, partial [Rhizobium freirei]|uniref:hypothetical protein n=1 Tax=Rhizobium freirei TaxID=1353277 RepID=UPI00056D741D
DGKINGAPHISTLNPLALPPAVRTTSRAKARSQPNLNAVRDNLCFIHCKAVRGKARALEAMLHKLILR